jgi:hypothetical protein
MDETVTGVREAGGADSETFPGPPTAPNAIDPPPDRKSKTVAEETPPHVIDPPPLHSGTEDTKQGQQRQDAHG